MLEFAAAGVFTRLVGVCYSSFRFGFSAMSTKSIKDGQYFPHKTGDVVLVKWRDGKIYFAKIKTIEWSKKRCVVIFDDKSQDLARFSWIHDGKSCAWRLIVAAALCSFDLLVNPF